MSLSKVAVQLGDNFSATYASFCNWLSTKHTVLYSAIPIAAIALAWHIHRQDKDLPPGPRFFLLSRFFTAKSTEEAEKNFLELCGKHGDVVSGKLFSTVIIILNTIEMVKAAYLTNGDSISGRIANGNSGLRIDRAPGILNASGEVWQEHRRFVLSNLRDLGFGKVRSETIIRDELEQLCAALREAGGNGANAIDPRSVVAKTSTNVICTLVFGERCGTEQEFERITLMLRDLQQNPINKLPLVLILLLSLAMKLPGDPFRIKRIFKNVDLMVEYVEQKIEEHRKRHKPGDDADLIDSYLNAQAEHEKNAPGKHSYTDPQLARVVLELFLAGTDTVATMVLWSLFLLATYPEVQAKVQQELAETLEGRLPSVVDRQTLKYTEAFIYEVHRFVVMLPLGGPPHRVTREVYIGGHRFPKDALIMVNLFSIFRDPKIWKYPHEFNPENFYDPSQKDKPLENIEHVISFMIGRRACPGESLAKQELFLFIAGLMQKFTVKFDPSSPQPNIKDSITSNFNRSPKDFKLVFTPKD